MEAFRDSFQGESTFCLKVAEGSQNQEIISQEFEPF